MVGRRAPCKDVKAELRIVAHAGLDNIITVSDVWGKFPINQVIRARWWRVPYDEVPRSADHEAQLQWLYGWWERIDTWIPENRPGNAAVPEVAELPEDETAEPVGELNAPRVRRDGDTLRQTLHELHVRGGHKLEVRHSAPLCQYSAKPSNHFPGPPIAVVNSTTREAHRRGGGAEGRPDSHEPDQL
jgi:hypothetical protein